MRFYGRALDGDEIAALDRVSAAARWTLEPSNAAIVRDQTGHGHDGTSLGGSAVGETREALLASFSPGAPGAEWQWTPDKNLRLKIPAGPRPVNFTLRLARAGNVSSVQSLTTLLDQSDEAIRSPPVHTWRSSALE